jgi:hypothetical protein
MRPRQTLELTAQESWQLLSSVSLGQIVFTLHAMPVIRPVNHLVDDQASPHPGPARPPAETSVKAHGRSRSLRWAG